MKAIGCICLLNDPDRAFGHRIVVLTLKIVSIERSRDN